ncbi:MAG: ThuA domain-containing protein [Terricaulis sp.]
MSSLLRWLAVLFAAVLVASCATPPPRTPHVLIFSHTTGYRHASIEPGIAAIQAIGARNGWVVDATEDVDVFAPGRLDGYDAIVLLHDTSSGRNPDSEWFVGARRDALQAFVHRGGGIVGIHAAADSHYNWPWYRQMIGAAFRRHPPGEPPGHVTLVDTDHPATRGLPTSITRADEWYYYVDFDPSVRLLAVYDPASIGQEGTTPNPISWSHDFEGGRVFYTGMGHTPESYSEDFFLRHVEGGLKWALRLEN